MMASDAYSCLDSLRTMLATRRQQLLEAMGNGFEDKDKYREYVGRCKEIKATIDAVSAQIKSLTGLGDDDADARKPKFKT